MGMGMERTTQQLMHSTHLLHNTTSTNFNSIIARNTRNTLTRTMSETAIYDNNAMSEGRVGVANLAANCDHSNRKNSSLRFCCTQNS